jgi:hypothetical protein
MNLSNSTKVPQAQSPCVQDAAPDSVNPSDDAHTSRRTSETQPFSDEEREDAIRRAGKAIEHHMALYASSSDLMDRGDADRARLLMQRLIAGRSAEQVGKLELERGLR